jgi:two-component system CheB/CheR fusion protein
MHAKYNSSAEEASVDATERDAGRDKLTLICHELRATASVVTTWAGLLERRSAGPDQRRHAGDAIHHSACTLARLAADLSAAEPNGAEFSLSRTTIDFRDIVVSVCELLAQTVAERGIILTRELPRGPVLIDGDRVRLTQIVWNLVGNALKFTPAAGRITITLDASDTRVALHVADSGRGMSKDFLPRVFEKFSREQRDRADRPVGRGLGLYLVRRLVRLHGGRIEAHSRGPGKGSRLSVMFPRLTSSRAVMASTRRHGVARTRPSSRRD